MRSTQINLKTNRVSIISSIEIHKGEIISKGMLDIKRPGIGIQPIDFEDIIGRKAKINISKDIPLTFDMLE